MGFQPENRVGLSIPVFARKLASSEARDPNLATLVQSELTSWSASLGDTGEIAAFVEGAHALADAGDLAGAAETLRLLAVRVRNNSQLHARALLLRAALQRVLGVSTAASVVGAVASSSTFMHAAAAAQCGVVLTADDRGNLETHKLPTAALREMAAAFFEATETSFGDVDTIIRWSGTLMDGDEFRLLAAAYAEDLFRAIDSNPTPPSVFDPAYAAFWEKFVWEEHRSEVFLDKRGLEPLRYVGTPRDRRIKRSVRVSVLDAGLSVRIEGLRWEDIKTAMAVLDAAGAEGHKVPKVAYGNDASAYATFTFDEVSSQGVNFAEQLMAWLQGGRKGRLRLGGPSLEP